MKTLQDFSVFYRQSKDRFSNKGTGQIACRDWLLIFTSPAYPRWLSSMTVANLSLAMKNYQVNTKEHSAVVDKLLELIAYYIRYFNAQEISNILLSLNKVELSWHALEAKNIRLCDPLLDSVSANVDRFTA